MSDSLRHVERNSWKNVEVNVSEFKLYDEERAIWELRNWNDSKNFKYLLAHTNCILYDENDNPSVRFYLKKQKIKEHDSKTHENLEDEYLSLWVAPFPPFKGYTEYEYGFTLKISIEYLSEDLNVVAPPLGYHSLPATYVTFPGENTPSEMMVCKKFIELLTSRHSFGMGKSQTHEIIKKPGILRYGITAGFFKCSEIRPTLKNTTLTLDPTEPFTSWKLQEMMEQERFYLQMSIESQDAFDLKDNAATFSDKEASYKLQNVIYEGNQHQKYLLRKVQIKDLDANPLTVLLNWMHKRMLDVDNDLAIDFMKNLREILPPGSYDLYDFFRKCDNLREQSNFAESEKFQTCRNRITKKPAQDINTSFSLRMLPLTYSKIISFRNTNFY